MPRELRATPSKPTACAGSIVFLGDATCDAFSKASKVHAWFGNSSTPLNS